MTIDMNTDLNHELLLNIIKDLHGTISLDESLIGIVFEKDNDSLYEQLNDELRQDYLEVMGREFPEPSIPGIKIIGDGYDNQMVIADKDDTEITLPITEVCCTEKAMLFAHEDNLHLIIKAYQLIKDKIPCKLTISCKTCSCS